MDYDMMRLYLQCNEEYEQQPSLTDRQSTEEELQWALLAQVVTLQIGDLA